MSEGRKDDTGKLRWDLLPWDELEDIVKVLTHGATEYGEYNWQKLDNAKARYHAAAMRHIVAWTQGKQLDDKSGLSHLAHAGCNLLFLAWFDRRREKLPGKIVTCDKCCLTCKWFNITKYVCFEPEWLRTKTITCTEYSQWESAHG